MTFFASFLLAVVGLAGLPWIGDGRPERQGADWYEADPAPEFVAEFVLPCGAVKGRGTGGVRFEFASPGYLQVRVNGRKTGSSSGSEAVFPLWSPFDRTVYSESVDVDWRDLKAHPLTNRVVVTLGNGWYNMPPLRFWGTRCFREALAHGRPCFKLAIDGVVEPLVWKWRETDIVQNSIQLGAVVDRTRPTDENWKPAREVAGPRGRLVPNRVPPVRFVRGETHVGTARWLKEGESVVVDFQRNVTGCPIFCFAETMRGQSIEIVYGERLNADGSVNPMTQVAGQIKKGNGGSGAPDVAMQRDVLVCRGEDRERFEPPFTWHVGRYAEIRGVKALPTMAVVRALRSDVADAEPGASFVSDDDAWTRIHDLCRRTFKANLVGVQSDCPGRERLGYGGDIVATCEAMMLNFDMREFYLKTLQDFADEAEDDGWITETAPFVGLADRGFGGRSGPISWALAVPVLIDGIIRHYPDATARALAFYPVCARYVALVDAKCPDGIVPMCIGDHEALERAPDDVTATAHWHEFVRLTASFARRLGRTEEAAKLSALQSKIAAAFQSKYVKDGVVANGTQSAQSIALYLGLVPADQVAAATARLLRTIEEKGFAPTTGIFSTRYMLLYLSGHGQHELARRIVRHRGFPGWLHMLDRGATTLWETWKESDDVFSNCHPMFGSVDEWLLKYERRPAVREMRRGLLEFKAGVNFGGADAYDGTGPCGAKVEDGRLVIAGLANTVGFMPFGYEPPRPFAGPVQICVPFEGFPVGGRAVLKVKERVRGAKPIAFETETEDGRAVFRTDLPLTGEYEFVSLEMSLPGGEKKPQTVVFRPPEAVYRPTEAGGIDLEVRTTSPLHVLDWSSREEAVAELRNRSTARASVSGELKVSDFYGRAFSLPLDLKLAPGEARTIAIPRAAGRADAKGVWKVVAALKAADGSTCTREDRFAILDEHPVTPKIPFGKFRIGIHCHSARWLGKDRDLTHDAAVRMGAKLVRIDDVFSQAVTWNPANKDFDFAKADRFLSDLERRGLAVDAIVQECGFGNFTADFCERIARHFGERIDYYEVGNEWDILPAARLTPERGVAIQKLAYTALKKGDPKVRVITNGWAVEDSNGHASVTQKGFQETFMRDAKGFYDLHAVHLHFPFRNYADRLGRFFKLREACGVTVPFLLNETALNVQYRGEEEVAENVWLKVVYGWAHGAADYIWYNMRASQFDPGGSYGVVNREFRPRLTFAAFSGLTATLGDHDFEKTIVEKEGRFVGRFRRRDGREIVLSGWDTGLMKPVEVPVQTDATRVWSADVMNNRRELSVEQGIVRVSLAGSPHAWIFENATFARLGKSILNVTKAPPRVIQVSAVRHDYGWDLLLDRYAQVHEEYPADPLTAHRTWKGKDDCSGTVLFTLTDGRPAIRISVVDEKDEPGDAVQVWRDGRDITGSLNLTRVRGGDNRTVYTAAWPDREACRVNVRFIDDDGFGGIDGWMDYAPFDKNSPDVDAWPILRFD